MKPDFPIEKLKKLLDRSNQDIIKIDPISFGMSAQAFDCHKKGDNLIFKISSSKQNLLKDKYAHENFDSTVVPVPEFISFGKVAPDLFFSVTKKIRGENLKEIDSEKRQKRALPLIAKTLDQIHNKTVEKNKGYGIWNAEGFAPYKSWKKFIVSIKDSTKNKWKKFITEYSVDQKLIENICEEIEHLSKYCPERRDLLHGDYRRDNIMWDGSKITGVIDWALSAYGDFVFDVAWLDFFEEASGSKIDHKNYFKKHYEKKGKDIKNYEERMRCYQLRIGLRTTKSNLLQGRDEHHRNIEEVLYKMLEK